MTSGFGGAGPVVRVSAEKGLEEAHRYSVDWHTGFRVPLNPERKWSVGNRDCFHDAIGCMCLHDDTLAQTEYRLAVQAVHERSLCADNPVQQAVCGDVHCVARCKANGQVCGLRRTVVKAACGFVNFGL